MGKNKRFTDTYVLTHTGITTNHFQQELMDKMLDTIVQGLNIHGKQTTLTIEKVPEWGK